MSYLDVPRLHFFGSFTANPSTLNNTPTNYNLPPNTGPSGGNNWNPKGDHTWLLQGCTVRTVIGHDGSPLQDILVGTAVSSTGTELGSNPKIVDLDTEQQMVSMIFGLQIQVGDSASGSVTGNFQPQPFLDITPDQQNAYYQSVLQNLTWNPDLVSPALRELQRISPDALSIKFNLTLISWDPPPAKGTITGTIGPASPGEPPNFLLGRLMRPTAAPDQPASSGHGHVQTAAQPTQSNPNYNYTPFVVDKNRGKVIVDFGNSQTVGGPATMQVAILPSQSPSQILGAVDTTRAAYQATAAIQEFDVTAEQLSLLQSSILGVLFEGSPILAEDENATTLAVTPLVCRLNPGDKVQIDLVALSFGAPAANQTIGIRIDNHQIEAYNTIVQPIGVPSRALQFLSNVTTDADGRASFTLTATPKGLGNPRGNIDGQIYGIGFCWPLASDLDPWVFVSVHVYDLVSVPASPDWTTDVLPILQPYRELYPYMDHFIDLTSQSSVRDNAQDIAHHLQLPVTDPRYMPVTRDLSASKKQIVLNWLRQQTQSGPGNITGGSSNQKP